ncbi:helix-turn-helix transcriptional regulator [Kribbella sindirgiensis]|uniref:helix-turn-helix transcriptional regulator n=1 Tax=Kribbella sindirgiensis TaxID=1124744 RepID=UPI0013F44C25|nr:WYL domain-containing protein [Kribbella sindirgiensis]
MRAERLVTVALLLQAHRKLTAPELARRLDVSERTIRRDLDALLLSGRPRSGTGGHLGAGADTGLRTFRVSRIVKAEATTEAVERPEDFDLVRAWEDVNRRHVPCWYNRVEVVFQVRPEDLGRVTSVLPEDAQPRPIDTDTGPARRFTATFSSVREAACELIYLGDGVQALEPPSVRAELVRIGHRLIATHTPNW